MENGIIFWAHLIVSYYYVTSTVMNVCHNVQISFVSEQIPNIYSIVDIQPLIMYSCIKAKTRKLLQDYCQDCLQAGAQLHSNY